LLDKRLQNLESISKILAAIAIPIGLAIGGWYIQNQLSKQAVSKDYVALAVSILQKPKVDTDSDIRSWAVDLLNENSPTKFSPQTVQRLKSGALDLSWALLTTSDFGGNGFVLSPDMKQIAISQNNTIQIYNAADGRKQLSLSGHTDNIVALSYTPDSAKLLSGSLDRTVRYWDLATGRQLATIPLPDAVSGLSATKDGSEVFVRVRKGPIRVYSLPDLKLTRTFDVAG
jgi:WD40 repeat protein